MSTSAENAPLPPALPVSTPTTGSYQAMPARASHSAPKFTGKGRELRRYFEDVEEACLAAGKSAEQDKIHYARHYADADEAESWTLIQSAAMTWVEFKDAVAKLYPDTSKKQCYTVADLEDVAMDYRDRGVSSREAVGGYLRQYGMIGEWLLDHQRILQEQFYKIFLGAFEPTLRDTIKICLSVADLAMHPDNGYQMEAIRDATNFIFGATSRSGETKDQIHSAERPWPVVLTPPMLHNSP